MQKKIIRWSAGSTCLLFIIEQLLWKTVRSLCFQDIYLLNTRKNHTFVAVFNSSIKQQRQVSPFTIKSRTMQYEIFQKMIGNTLASLKSAASRFRKERFGAWPLTTDHWPLTTDYVFIRYRHRFNHHQDGFGGCMRAGAVLFTVNGICNFVCKVMSGSGFWGSGGGDEY